MLRPFRKNHKRRFIVFFIAAVLAAGSAGCGKNPNPAPVKTTASVGAASQMTKSSGTARAVSQTAENGTEEIDAESLKPQEIELTYNVGYNPVSLSCKDYILKNVQNGKTTKRADMQGACLDSSGENIYYVYVNWEDVKMADISHGYAVDRKNIKTGSTEQIYRYENKNCSTVQVSYIGCAGNCLLWDEEANDGESLVKFDLVKKKRALLGTDQGFLFSLPGFSVVNNQFYWFGGLAGDGDTNGGGSFRLYCYNPATGHAERFKTEGSLYLDSPYDSPPGSGTSVNYCTKDGENYYITEHIINSPKKHRIKTGSTKISFYNADGNFAAWSDEAKNLYFLNLQTCELYHYNDNKKSGSVHGLLFHNGKIYFILGKSLVTVDFKSKKIVNQYLFDPSDDYDWLSEFKGGLYISGRNKKEQNVMKVFAL